MFNMLQNFDLMLLEWISNNLHNPILDKIFIVLTTLGDNGLIWIIIALLLLVTKKYRKAGFLILCALLLNLILVNGLLKNIVQRTRPFDAVPTVQLLISKPSSFSFPSGHTSSAFAAVGIISSLMKKYRLYFIALAILIAFSRMYLFVHYPTDIIGGAMMGIICAKVVLILYELIKSRLKIKKENLAV